MTSRAVGSSIREHVIPSRHRVIDDHAAEYGQVGALQPLDFDGYERRVDCEDKQNRMLEKTEWSSRKRSSFRRKLNYWRE